MYIFVIVFVIVFVVVFVIVFVIVSVIVFVIVFVILFVILFVIVFVIVFVIGIEPGKIMFAAVCPALPCVLGVSKLKCKSTTEFRDSRAKLSKL